MGRVYGTASLPTAHSSNSAGNRQDQLETLLTIFPAVLVPNQSIGEKSNNLCYYEK
jgi:hypothetical protein